jgi:hypothetical protein
MTGIFADGRLAFSTYRKAVKTRNALRDPRTCSLALEGYPGAGASAVVVRGEARVVEGEAAARKLAGGGAAAGPVSKDIASRSSARLAEGKRVVLVIEPREVDWLRSGDR